MTDNHDHDQTLETQSTASSLKWNPTLGGRREGSGRPRLYMPGRRRIEREVRIAIPRNLHNTWVTYKRLCGCKSDGQFAKYLLELAEKNM